MSRSLTGAAETAALASHVRLAMAVELDFASGFIRVNSTPYRLTIFGNVYLGVGKAGRMSEVQENGQVQAYQTALELYGIPRDLIGIALAEHYQGRAARIYGVLFDENHGIIADPFVMFAGRMDTMTITLGETAAVRLVVESRLADWERPRIRRYTSEDQKSEFPADLFFDYVPSMIDKVVKWNA